MKDEECMHRDVLGLTVFVFFIFLYSILQAEEFEDIKGVIRIRKSKKNRQHKGQKYKQRSTKHTHKGCELRCSGRITSSCSTSGTRHVNLFTNSVILSFCLSLDVQVLFTPLVSSNISYIPLIHNFILQIIFAIFWILDVQLAC